MGSLGYTLLRTSTVACHDAKPTGLYCHDRRMRQFFLSDADPAPVGWLDHSINDSEISQSGGSDLADLASASGNWMPDVVLSLPKIQWVTTKRKW